MRNKHSKMWQMSFLSMAVAGAMGAAPAANAEVAASVSVANMYLWRGFDLGNGDPAVSGDLTLSAGGFYGGVWASSGDATYGTEYDLFAGFNMELGAFEFDISVWNYVYPSSPSEECDANDNCVPIDNVLDDFGGLSEVILTVGVAGFSFSYYDNIAGGPGYEYYTLGYGYEAFSATMGMHDNEDDEALDTVHLDLSYAYNDNLSFTVSQQVSDEVDDDLKFVVSYSLPLEM